MVTPILLCLLLGGTSAGAAGLQSDKDPAVEEEIKALELHLADLLVRGDIDTYSSYLADDYTRINDRGEVQSRAEVLRLFRAAPGGGVMEPTDLVVQSYGATAILTGVLKTKGPLASDPARTRRFRKVFVRRAGRWYLVSLQGSPYEPR